VTGEWTKLHNEEL